MIYRIKVGIYWFKDLKTLYGMPIDEQAVIYTIKVTNAKIFTDIKLASLIAKTISGKVVSFEEVEHDD